MAIVTLAPHVAAISGTIGELTYVSLGGKQIIRHRRRKTRRTAGQNVQPKRIKEAAAYWRSLEDDPGRKAFYLALPPVPSMGAYQFAVRDFLNPPIVHEIDASDYSGRAGQPIRIHASDDTGVAEVAVRIATMDGAVVEVGFASLADRHWVYLSIEQAAPGQAVSIHATAKDRPGNAASKEALAYTR
jgi:hypothetical protein